MAQEAITMFPQSPPVDAVTGLFPDRTSAEAAMTSLSAAGFTPTPVHPRHAGHCRLQEWGRDATIMNLYLEGWQQGHELLIVPAPPADRERVGRLLSRHRGHAIYYFTAGSVESLSRSSTSRRSAITRRPVPVTASSDSSRRSGDEVR